MDIKMCSFPCRWVCWPTRWRLRERRFEIWTCVWKSTGRNLTPPRRCCNRCVYFIRDKASFWDSDDHFMYLYISSHYNGVHAVVPVYSAGTVYLTATKQYFFVLQIKKKCFFYFFILLLQELLCRTSLETQKLELMSEVSTLKLKLNSMDKERLNFDDRFRDSEVHKLLLWIGILSVFSLTQHIHAHLKQTLVHVLWDIILIFQLSF